MEKTDKKKIGKEIADFLFMVVGCVFYAFGTSVFFQPESIVAGGVSGLAVAVNYLNGNLPVGVLIIAFNAPILLLGLKFKGWKFILKCLITIVVLGGVTDLVSFLVPPIAAGNKLLCALYGGVCQGVGIGLFVRFEYSSGGTELLGRVIAKILKFSHIPIAIGVLDALVVITGTIVTGDPLNMLYAVIGIVANTKVSELVITGLNKSKLCLISANKGEAIAEELISHSPRGVTMLEGTGMYTKAEHKVLMTCVKSRQLTQLKQIVKSVDEKAFIIVNDSVEVRGKGFEVLE
ncbi:MAG TPA: hypothetical protein DDW54_03140 [Clostridiales bacterium]|nr:hypothetical protein [Clostridiales bacterium]